MAAVRPAGPDPMIRTSVTPPSSDADAVMSSPSLTARPPTPAGGPGFPVSGLVGRGVAHPPHHQAADREHDPDDEVGGPGVRVAEDGRRQVDVEEPHGGDGEQDAGGRDEQGGEQSVDDAAGDG